MTEYCQSIICHYASFWSNVPVERRWESGPISELPDSFRVLEFGPTSTRTFWTYATCCMSQLGDLSRIELHLFSPVKYDGHVELLTAIAHYHRTGKKLDLGHTVNFGRPWLNRSVCEYGLISLPYLDGPALQHLRVEQSRNDVQFLWLLPISETEKDFKKEQGIEALERRFEDAGLNYLDPNREVVV